MSIDIDNILSVVEVYDLHGQFLMRWHYRSVHQWDRQLFLDNCTVAFVVSFRRTLNAINELGDAVCFLLAFSIQMKLEIFTFPTIVPTQEQPQNLCSFRCEEQLLRIMDTINRRAFFTDNDVVVPPLENDRENDICTCTRTTIPYVHEKLTVNEEKFWAHVHKYVRFGFYPAHKRSSQEITGAVEIEGYHRYEES